MKKERLDILVLQAGLVSSRERARAEIMSGNVLVNGQRLDKPGHMAEVDAVIKLKNEIMPFVSRGGLKLQKALEVFAIEPEGKICLDCGASTGGFTDCLLQAGAVKVYAIDVGYGQLAWSLREDERVVSLERTNVRYLTSEQVPDKIGLAVADLSFISLRLVLPAIYDLLCDEGELVCLVKPQFEAGREKVGKKGVVRDAYVHAEVLRGFRDYAEKAGFALTGLDFSPIKGPEGNIEYLAYLSRASDLDEGIDIDAVVLASHTALS